MSAYNTLVLTNDSGTVTLQFKYGDTWQYEYHIGDRIKWGGNQIGSPDYKNVAVDAILETADISKEVDYVIIIEEGIITEAFLNDGTYNFNNTNDGFIIMNGQSH